MVFNIKPYERKIFELIQLSANELGVPVYVVGGYVRDRLLARESNDLDVVCVGDGIALAEKLATKLIPTPYIAVYRRFGTAMIRHKDIEIEFVGARKESYSIDSVSYTHLRAHETVLDLVCRLLLEKKTRTQEHAYTLISTNTPYTWQAYQYRQ